VRQRVAGRLLDLASAQQRPEADWWRRHPTGW
jgi:hypothetical protein